MTDAAQHAHFPAAEDLDFQAAQWIERQNCTDWTHKDQDEFDRWIDKSSAHRVAFLRLDSGWRNTERLAALHAETGDVRSAFGRIFMAGKIVAAAVVLAALCMGAIHALTPRYTTYATAIGGHETVALGNGSSVELNTGTLLRVSRDGRKAILERGEAYFDIVHDNNRAFAVVAGNGQIMDLGTKFLVRRDSDRLAVTLFEGRARYDGKSADGTRRTATLEPGDTIVASGNFLFTGRKSEAELSRILGWRRNILTFDDTPLADAVAELNRYNNVKVVLADPAIGKIGVGGTFAKNNVTGFAHVAQNILHLHVVQRGNAIVIAR